MNYTYVLQQTSQEAAVSRPEFSISGKSAKVCVSSEAYELLLKKESMFGLSIHSLLNHCFRCHGMHTTISDEELEQYLRTLIN